MFDGIHHYKNFLDSFSNVKKKQYNSLKNDVSLKLYQDWFIMHYATWQHASGEFKRDTRLALADVFQDLLCFYFNTFLPSPYISIPECTIQSKPRLQVDIAIKKNNKIVFLIEV